MRNGLSYRYLEYSWFALFRADSTKRQADFSKGRPLLHLSFPTASQALLFDAKYPDAKYPLTSKNSPPILPPIEDNTSSNQKIGIEPSRRIGVYATPDREFCTKTLEIFRKIFKIIED